MSHGNRPTPECRREAVRLALTSSRTRKEVAKDWGRAFDPDALGEQVSRRRGTPRGKGWP